MCNHIVYTPIYVSVGKTCLILFLRYLVHFQVDKECISYDLSILEKIEARHKIRSCQCINEILNTVQNPISKETRRQ